KIGNVSLKLGDREGVLKCYLKALSIRQELVAADSESADSRTELARIYESLGAYYMSLAAAEKRISHWSEARHWYQESMETFRELQQQNKLSADYDTKPNQIRKTIETCDAVLAKR